MLTDIRLLNVLKQPSVKVENLGFVEILRYDSAGYFQITNCLLFYLNIYIYIYIYIYMLSAVILACSSDDPCESLFGHNYVLLSF